MSSDLGVVEVVRTDGAPADTFERGIGVTVDEKLDSLRV